MPIEENFLVHHLQSVKQLKVVNVESRASKNLVLELLAPLHL